MRKTVYFIILILALTSCRQAPGASTSIWKPYSQEALREAVHEQKPVVIDFYADWCPNCQDLDRTVFVDPAIVAKLALVTALRVDVTNMDDSRVQSVVQTYGIEGVPTVVFLDSHGREITDARVMGLVSSKEFSQALAMLKIFK